MSRIKEVEGAPAAQEVNNESSVALVFDCMGEHEKTAWMLRAIQ